MGENSQRCTAIHAAEAQNTAGHGGTTVAHPVTMHPFPHRYVVSSTATPDGSIVLASPGIQATVVLPDEVDEDQAHRILTRAEETCLITRSLNGETHLDIEIQRVATQIV